MNVAFDREKVLKSYIENKEKLDKRNREGIEKYIIWLQNNRQL